MQVQQGIRARKVFMREVEHYKLGINEIIKSRFVSMLFTVLLCAGTGDSNFAHERVQVGVILNLVETERFVKLLCCDVFSKGERGVASLDNVKEFSHLFLKRRQYRLHLICGVIVRGAEGNQFVGDAPVHERIHLGVPLDLLLLRGERGDVSLLQDVYVLHGGGGARRLRFNFRDGGAESQPRLRAIRHRRRNILDQILRRAFCQ